MASSLGCQLILKRSGENSLMIVGKSMRLQTLANTNKSTHVMINQRRWKNINNSSKLPNIFTLKQKMQSFRKVKENPLQSVSSQ